MPTHANTRLRAWLAAGACLALIACETRSGPDTDMKPPRSSAASTTSASTTSVSTNSSSIPAIDVDAPAVIQTATFALG